MAKKKEKKDFTAQKVEMADLLIARVKLAEKLNAITLRMNKLATEIENG